MDIAKEISNQVVSTLGGKVNKESVMMIIALYEMSKKKDKEKLS